MKSIFNNLTLLAAMVAVGGCTADMRDTVTVSHFPPFYTPDLKTIAVAPFDPGNSDPRSADIVAAAAAQALAADGTYTVIGGQRLERMAKGYGVELARYDSPQTIAAKLGKIPGIQAAVVGKITHLTTGNNVNLGGSGSSFNEIWDRNYTGRQKGVANKVALKADVVMIGVDRQFSAQAREIAGEFTSAGVDHPDMSVDQCLEQAAKGMGQQLAQRFVAKSEKVAIYFNKTLTTEAENSAGKTEATRHFNSDQEMIVQVRLPAQCRYNRMRLAVTASSPREAGDMAAAFNGTAMPTSRPATTLAIWAMHDFTWGDNATAYTWKFPLKSIAAKTGPGWYAVNLYCSNQHVTSVTFKINK
ncbi:MAG: hypothetical protein ABFD92_05670 [Planctomycetaceae bacterium]|nr:hypothetical protein [Planctomycetaceae bacterium]